MTDQERKAQEICFASQFKLRTTLRKFIFAVAALGGGAGIGTVSNVLFTNNNVDVAAITTELKLCRKSEDWLADYATKCNEYTQRKEEELRAKERASLPSDIPEYHTYDGVLKK